MTCQPQPRRSGVLKWGSRTLVHESWLSTQRQAVRDARSSWWGDDVPLSNLQKATCEVIGPRPRRVAVHRSRASNATSSAGTSEDVRNLLDAESFRWQKGRSWDSRPDELGFSRACLTLLFDMRLCRFRGVVHCVLMMTTS